jgi:hypothetical protein
MRDEMIPEDARSTDGFVVRELIAHKDDGESVEDTIEFMERNLVDLDMGDSEDIVGFMEDALSYDRGGMRKLVKAYYAADTESMAYVEKENLARRLLEE